MIGDGMKMFRKYQLDLEVRDSSNDVMHCDVCRKAGPDIAGKTEKKKFKRESLIFLNKSLKHAMVLAKAHSSSKHLVSHSGRIIAGFTTTYAISVYHH
jgi:hypothetical protein